MTTAKHTPSAPSVWSGPVPVDDTALAVTDTGGPAQPVVYLNGAYASQRHWQRVIHDLGEGYRHLSYDERARGASQTSADYSFEACVRDLDAVLEARGVARPILVGWSYGAMVALHWARRNPARIVGVVAVDGAMPYDWIDDAARERLRNLFHRLRWALPVAHRLGLAARMSAQQHAEVNVELNELLGTVDGVLDELSCPVRYLLSSGGHLGAGRAEMERVHASLGPALQRNPNVTVSAKVASNHSSILRRDFRAVAATVREIAAADASTELGG